MDNLFVMRHEFGEFKVQILVDKDIADDLIMVLLLLFTVMTMILLILKKLLG